MKNINILLVEDNPGDIRLIKEAMKDSKLKFEMVVKKDGVEASNYLTKIKNNKSEIKCPDLIILDLNLPRKDGRELLKEIKEDLVLKIIPVVILTSSSADEDILKSYNLHANCYVTKPLDFDQFVKIVQSINGFWFSIVKLPNNIK